jgi:hypothetical protein
MEATLGADLQQIGELMGWHQAAVLALDNSEDKTKIRLR